MGSLVALSPADPQSAIMAQTPDAKLRRRHGSPRPDCWRTSPSPPPPKGPALPLNPINSHGADLASERTILHTMSPSVVELSVGLRSSVTMLLFGIAGPWPRSTDGQSTDPQPDAYPQHYRLISRAVGPCSGVGGCSVSYITASGTPALSTFLPYIHHGHLCCFSQPSHLSEQLFSFPCVS